MKLRSSFFTPVFFLVSFLLSASPLLAQAADEQAPTVEASRSVLFSSYDSLEVRLEAPLADLFAKKTGSDFFAWKKARVAGRLVYQDHSIPVEIRMRGFSTLFNCRFPKLTLKIEKDQAKGTPFEGLGKVDLGTHCDSVTDDSFKTMKFNHRESLIYRWLNILGIPSYATRPAMFTYHDTSTQNALADTREQAFFIENLSSFLKRAHGIEIRAQKDETHAAPAAGEEPDPSVKKIYTDVPNHPQIDLQQMARIDFFEKFIGNGDYHLEANLIWNLKLVELPNGSWFPIPMDFNFATVVMGFHPVFDAQAPFLAAATKELKLQIIATFESQRALLYDSLTSLADDPAGVQLFKTTLDSQFALIEKFKTSLP